MKLNEYQEVSRRTIPTNKLRQLRIAEFALALCEEAGESAGVVKKVNFHNHPFNQDKREKLIGELGDVMWHIAAIATEFDITLEEIATANIEKLMQRYPNGFNAEDSQKRVDTK